MRGFVIFVIFVVICGCFISIITNIIDTGDLDDFNKNVNYSKRPEKPVGADFDRLFWIVQVTDIHISKFWDFKRSPDLLEFCKNYLTVIQPDFVIASGDLTDAKQPDKHGSKQFDEEWKLYKETVSKCRALNKNVKWMDLRGNHDSFDVPTYDDPKNLFRRYSMQGEKNPSSYHYTHVKKYGKYSFIAMDATPDPGPRRPFNFFGFLSTRQRVKLDRFSREASGSNLTIWFGHYTTSLIVSEDEMNIRKIMRNATAYLCGHLHTLADLVPQMYTLHKTGTLELELGDWKDNRKFRILAVDHDVLSFSDETLGSWPAVIITNPVHAKYNSPKHPAKVNSTHIRLLIFSPYDITKVKVSLDGLDLGEAYHVQGPLYVYPWNPEKYSKGLHKLRVIVEDKGFNRREIVQPFSLDGTRPEFAMLPRLVLMMNIYDFGKILYQILACLYVLILVFMRRCDSLTSLLLKNDTGSCCHFMVRWVNVWLKRIWYVTRFNTLFYTLTLFMVYVSIGPWFIAEVIEGHMGMVFIWAMYVKGAFLPGSLTYIYGIFQIVTFHIPLLLFLGYLIHFNTVESAVISRPPSLIRRIRNIYVPFCSFLFLQTYVCITEFPRAYGTRAFLLGPVRTGSVVLALLLFYFAKNLSIPSPDSKLSSSNYKSQKVK